MSLFTDGEASDKLTGITSQHRERKTGDDIGDGGKEDSGRKFRRAETWSDAAQKAVRETSRDPVAGDRRHIDHRA